MWSRAQEIPAQDRDYQEQQHQADHDSKKGSAEMRVPVARVMQEGSETQSQCHRAGGERDAQRRSMPTKVTRPIKWSG